MAVRGWAVRVSVSPLAIPMRLSPKSTERMTCGRPSGMTRERGELAGFHAEQPERCQPTLLVGQVEDHALVRGHREPGVVEHLFFELAGFPARVAKRDERLFRSGAGRHGGEYVARSGDLDELGDLVCRVPRTARTVQHEAAILVNRATAQHR